MLTRDEILNLEKGYSVKIQQLFEANADDLWNNRDFDDYEKFNFTQDDIAELTKLALDDRYNEIDYEKYEEETDRFFDGTIFAIRILGKFRVTEVMKPLIIKLYKDYDNDFLSEMMIPFFGDIGKDAIEFIKNEIMISKEDKLIFFDALKKIIENNPQEREKICSFLVEYLENTNDDSSHIAFALYLIKEFDGIKSIDFVRYIYETKEVDIGIDGDFEDFEIAVGLREKRTKPRKRTNIEKLVSIFDAYEDREEKINPLDVISNIGRNDPCFCGSGKKYKKCCLNK